MHISVQRLNVVKNKVKEIINRKQLKTAPQIIAVTKSFSLDKINFFPESSKSSIVFDDTIGMKFNLLKNKWYESSDASVNYISTFLKN